MDKDRKTLKEYSVVILILAVFSLIRMVVDVCVYGFDVTSIAIAGTTAQVIEIVTIIIFAVAILLLIPDVFVGIRGIKEANNPTGKKGHIVWSLILAILAAIATVIAIIDIAKGYSTSKLVEVLDVAVDVALFVAYYITAKKVAKNK